MFFGEEGEWGRVEDFGLFGWGGLDNVCEIRDVKRTQDTSPSKKRWKTCSFDRIGCLATRLRKVCNMRLRRAMRAASSFAFVCLMA